MCIKEMQVTVLVKNCLEMKDVLLISVIMLFFKEDRSLNLEELVSRENDLSTLKQWMQESL